MRKEIQRRVVGIGDIHGRYDLLLDLVERSIIFNPETDKLVFLGDYIDRGPQSRDVVEYLSGLKTHYPGQIILLKGNHEEMAFNALTGDNNGWSDAHMLWLVNGGLTTINSYKGIENARGALVQFTLSLKYYHETANHVFVHGGIPDGKSTETATADEMLWDRSFSYQGEKMLVVGHTPKSRVAKLGNIICLDTGAYATGILSAYDVLNDRVYQTCLNEEQSRADR